MPPYCRRCYSTFDSETQLTEHFRSASTCPVRSPVNIEGITKEQESALKGRRTMFQAGSEEEKWKIIYLILFPDTALSELPSPCKLHALINCVDAHLPRRLRSMQH